MNITKRQILRSIKLTKNKCDSCETCFIHFLVRILGKEEEQSACSKVKSLLNSQYDTNFTDTNGVCEYFYSVPLSTILSKVARRTKV